MHGYKWPINCTRTRTRDKKVQRQALPSVRCGENGAPAVHKMRVVNAFELAVRVRGVAAQGKQRRIGLACATPTFENMHD